ncbi:CDP-alcohol phosphatidyltransferase family protein [Methanobacterium alkalithermotolerans]|uniref:Archaetidylinositol phosphate synthase n=1 Tax=Methanobacterium alkalithermotolerans TaxID=2731220 RepID=A0A8T8K572_9EURY|nr:archaetidylinositol phosphate synthase [Methanobacterium alkalithermotolerans]QUH23674.1 CDP-alcohol phosphatidyltransferase family protein [Methanobacterium alkalithermotolerans]RJS49759.1 MAG: phosphatidylglycerophosphate synthase [Methanobacterium sp.]
MLNRFRPTIKGFLDPLARKIKINPNLITIFGLIVAFLSAYSFAIGNLLLGGILIALSGFLDIVDGAVARNNSSITPFGGFLDSTVDRLSDALIIIGIVYGGFVNWIFGILALHASLTVSYVRARAEVEGIPCGVGIAERAERLVIIMSGAFLGVLFGPEVMLIAMLLVIVLGYMTVGQRIYHTWKQMNKDLK